MERVFFVFCLLYIFFLLKRNSEGKHSFTISVRKSLYILEELRTFELKAE